MEPPTDSSDLLLKLNKVYRKYHDETEAQQVRLKTDAVGEQIDVAFKKYIFPIMKKAAIKGISSVTINQYQINFDFVKANRTRFEQYCRSHQFNLAISFHPQLPSEITGITISGWDKNIPKLEKHQDAEAPKGQTLTERVVALEELCKFLDREIQNLRAGKP